MAEVLTNIRDLIHVKNYACAVSFYKSWIFFSFHCFIDNCNFHSTTLKDVLTHLGDHPQAKWDGFCYACDSQIRNEEDELLHEVDHISQVHYDWSKYQSLKDDNERPTLLNTLSAARKRRLSDKKHNSDDPTLTVDDNSDSTLYDSCPMSVEPLDESSSMSTLFESYPMSVAPSNDESTFSTLYESGSITGDPLNNGSLSATQTQSNSIIFVVSDDEDEPAKKKPRSREPIPTFTMTNGQPNKSNETFIHYKCWYCVVSADSPGKIYKHWEGKEDHKSCDFLFTIEKVFKCFYCRTCTTYKDLKAHISDKHKGNTFAMIDNLNPKRCGLGCGMVENKMDDHFREKHNEQKTETETEIKISDDLNNEMLDNIIERIKNDRDIKMNVSNDSITFRYCCKCRVNTENEYEIAEHIRSHFIRFKCEYENCDKQFKEESLLKAHQKCMHSDQSDYKAYPNIDFEEFKHEYELMQIKFPCGLLLTKRVCKETKYGCMDNIRDIVRQIDKKDLEERKKIQEELKKEADSKASTQSKQIAKKPKRKAK